MQVEFRNKLFLFCKASKNIWLKLHLFASSALSLQNSIDGTDMKIWVRKYQLVKLEAEKKIIVLISFLNKWK